MIAEVRPKVITGLQGKEMSYDGEVVGGWRVV